MPDSRRPVAPPVVQAAQFYSDDISQLGGLTTSLAYEVSRPPARLLGAAEGP